MGRDLSYRPGSFYRTDDRTGFVQRAERTKKEWNGLIVDETVFEARQPQDLVKGVKDDQSVPEARPLAPNVFVGPTFVQLSEAAVVTQTVLEVQSTAGFYAGVEVSVMLDSGVLFTTFLLVSPGAGSITLAAPLPYSAASGNLITNYHRLGGSPAIAPVNIVAPAIVGSAIDGATLALSTGIWSGDPDGYTAQWFRNGSPIALETAFTHLVAGLDVGQDLSAEVTASNSAGDATAPSNTVVPIAAAAPSNSVAPAITGSTVEGGTATLSTGIWTGAPSGYSAQWFRGVTPIMGETGFTHLYTGADVGLNITGQVIASNSFGPGLEATSNIVVPTAAPSGIPIPNQAALVAMFNAGVVASGGKTYLLAATSFGDTELAGYDFSSDPVIIIGQAGTVFTSLHLSAVKGVTWDSFNVEGSGTGTGVTVGNGSAHVTFNLVTSNPASPEGNGFAIDSSSFITVNGASDASAPDIDNRATGVVVTDSTSITLSGLTLTNVGPDGILMAGVDTIIINACLGFDWAYEPGDHPDFIQGFTSFHTGDGNTNVTITNCGWLRQTGLPAQGYFFESTSNLVLNGNYCFGGFSNVVQQSGGVTALIDDNFGQGFGDFTAEIVTRDGTVDASVTNNIIEFVNNVGTNPGYTASGNTVIGPTTPGDYTDLDIWLAAHPSARARPI